MADLAQLLDEQRRLNRELTAELGKPSPWPFLIQRIREKIERLNDEIDETRRKEALERNVVMASASAVISAGLYAAFSGLL